MKSRTVMVFILTGLVAGATSATDYYVSSIHSNRSDSNSGTSTNAPWATMEKVRTRLDGLKPGDTIYLERGSVFEVNTSVGNDGENYLKLQAGGTAGHPVTLTGTGYGTGAKPIIRRTGGEGKDYFILIRDSYCTVQDIELDGNMAGGFSTCGIHLWADDPTDGSNGIVQNIQVLNNYIHNLGGATGGGQESDPTRYVCGIWLETAEGYSMRDCLIEGNTISDYSAHGLNCYPGDHHNNIWRNNVVSNSYPYRDQTVNSALQAGTGTGNIFENNCLYDSTLTSQGAVIRLAAKGANGELCTVRNNVIVGSGHHGIHFVQSNVSGPWVMKFDVYGNIIYNCKDSGIIVQPGGDWANGSVLNIYNNTLYNNLVRGGTVSDGEITIGSGCNNTTINLKNNLIYHPDSSSSVCLALTPSHNATIAHNNNLYYRTGTASKIAINNQGTQYTLANVASYESSARSTDPLFVNPATPPTSTSHAQGASPDGLSVQSASPAIGAGANLGSAFALDIDGNLRAVPWDIGAYQFAGGGEPQIPAPPSRPRVILDI